MTDSSLSQMFRVRVSHDQLAGAPSDVLNKLARIWGGQGTETKAVCVALITEGLADPARVRAALTDLNPEARAALAIVKESGGAVRAAALELMLRAYGYQLRAASARGYSFSYGWQRGASPFLGDLARAGYLVIHQSGSPYPRLRSSDGVGGEEVLYADERLLAGVDWPVAALPLRAPVAEPPTGAVRRSPQHVLLDLMGVAEAVGAVGRLTFTKAGGLRVAGLRQVAKRMGWAETHHFDGYRLPGLTEVVILAFHLAGWLVPDRTGLVLAANHNHGADQPLARQAQALARAFLALDEWTELGDSGWHDWAGLRALRAGVFHCLRALPEGNQFYRLHDFVTAIYDRVGMVAQTTHDHQNHEPNPQRSDLGEYATELVAWQERHRAFWLEHEQPFIKAVLTSWMYWLCLVEIGKAGSGVVCFRLTGLGRAVVNGDVEGEVGDDTPASSAEDPAWVVQPNYDLIVYLERARPADLAFLERHAERRQAEPHVLHYQLTRESVYRGLEGGTTVEEVLDTLRWGSGTDLPQNVEREIREWGEQRERVTLRRKATLIAFPDAETRERALQAGLPGRPVGDRYVLESPRARIKPALHAVYGPLTLPSLDYSNPLPPCLRAEEDGTLRLVRDTGDLLLPGQLSNCAEPVDAKRWRMTPASLAKLRQAGVPAATLLDFLRDRAVEELPPLLEMAIRNALGSRSSVQAESGLVLRITDKALYTALTTSPTLQPLLLDVPGPDTLVISREHEQEFRAKLEWLGVRLTDYKRATDRPDWLQTVKDARSQKRRHWRYY